MAKRFVTTVWLSETVSLNFATEGVNKIDANKSVLNRFDHVLAISSKER